MIRILILGISILLFSCDSFQNENETVTFRWDTERLIIENNSPETIYYAAFEQDIVSSIDWFPASGEQNRILSKEVKEVPEEEIFGYENGKTIVLYYWINDEPPFDNIESNVIETD